MNRRERKLWRSARTLDDLGQLMARWLEGDLRHRPGYYGTTDLDTPRLTKVCAELCRAGFVTDSSQEGGEWLIQGRSVHQRAGIGGFADDDALDALRQIGRQHAFVVSAHRRPSLTGLRRRIPVTAENWQACTWFGGQIETCHYEIGWSGISDEAYWAVLWSWHVAIIDPEWGRRGLLVAALAGQLATRGAA
jgi:hypothetical protein